jgi:transcription initiation factor IIE alpha subunit
MTGNALAIYNLFVKHRELNDHEIERLLKINPNSIRSIRLKLEEFGIIKRTEIKKRASKGVAMDSRGKYTMFKLIKEIDPEKMEKRKSKKISKTTVIKNLKSLRKKVIVLEKTISSIIRSMI